MKGGPGDPRPRLSRSHSRGSQPRLAPIPGWGDSRTGEPSTYTRSPMEGQRYGLDDADFQFRSIVRGNLIEPDAETETETET